MEQLEPMTRTESGPGWSVTLGDSREVLAHVRPNLTCADPPYGERTHKGHDAAAEQVRSATGQKTRRELNYGHLTSAQARECARFWAERTTGWTAFQTSHDLILPFEDGARDAGRYPFAPVWIKQFRPRLLGDGPSSPGQYMIVSRPRTQEFARWSKRPGGRVPPSIYESYTEKGAPVAGAKPVSLMRAIIRDYSNPGDIVCDPYAGGGSTIMAAVLEGRIGVGAEVDPKTFDALVDRLRHGFKRQDPRQERLEF